MNTLKFGAVATAAVALALAFGPGAAAQAQPVPEGPVKLYLKDHQEIPLAAVDGVPRLSSGGDHWEFRAEALQDLGEYQIVHQETGQCLAADTSRGGETAPVRLSDCATAHAWTIIYHNPGHKDFRFVAQGEYLLGLVERSDAVEGAEILAIREDPGDSMHFHEWLTEAGGEATPPPDEQTPPPSPTPTPSEAAPSSESESPKPTLPTTGTALGAGIGAGVVALAGGTALVLWWQRRRALRADW